MARRSHRRRKHGFASWSIGKKLGVILGGTFAAVAATGVVLVASKMTKIETTELDTDKLNMKKADEYKYLKQSCCYSIAGVDDAQMFRTVTV